MKIYTKTGDKGTTGLFGGKRVSKSSPRISAYGDVDELNAILGIVISHTKHAPFKQTLEEIQKILFIIGAELASPNSDTKIEVVTSAQVDSLERQMDTMSDSLSQLKTFILPGGGATGSYLHLARTVCRRAERKIVYLTEQKDEQVDKWVLIYLNRLSDFLFLLARLSNQLDNIPDVPWLPTKK